MQNLNIKSDTHWKALQSQIDTLIVKGPTTFQQIVAEVKTTFTVKNWRHVRSVIQSLEKGKLIKRDADLSVEIYHSI